MNPIISSVLFANDINEDYIELHTSGLANRVFATQNYIIRIPTDHEEAISDAKTESVAAPVARYHGIITPRLIKYDDSCVLLDKSYSIWERVHGCSVDQVHNKYEHKEIWTTLGKELGKLHAKVKECADPNDWLDSPERDYSLSDIIFKVSIDYSNSSKLILLINELYESINCEVQKVFVHGDTHAGNIMCSSDYAYSGLIDWGDSGWADPTIDFYMIPYQVIDLVLSGYKSTNGIIVNEDFINKIILDKIWKLLEVNSDIDKIYSLIRCLETKLK